MFQFEAKKIEAKAPNPYGAKHISGEYKELEYLSLDELAHFLHIMQLSYLCSRFLRSIKKQGFFSAKTTFGASTFPVPVRKLYFFEAKGKK